MPTTIEGASPPSGATHVPAADRASTLGARPARYILVARRQRPHGRRLSGAPRSHGHLRLTAGSFECSRLESTKTSLVEPMYGGGVDSTNRVDVPGIWGRKGLAPPDAPTGP